MRRRKPEELSAAALQAERMNNPAQLPSYFRKLVRLQMAEPALERLRQTAMGELAFKRPMIVNKSVQIVECEANEATQRQALVDLLSIALPRQAGFVDDEGNTQTGIVLLPPLDGPEVDDGRHEIVEENVDFSRPGQYEDPERPSSREEKTVDPALVAQIIALRKTG